MSIVIDNERVRRLLHSCPEEAIALLYDLFRKKLFKIALRLTKDAKASEDIIQETFIHIWNERENLSRHEKRSIEYYLVRVVKNRSISFYKKKKPVNFDTIFTHDPHHIDNLLFEESIETKIISQDLTWEIKNLISTFPTREKQCLLLKIEAGMSLDEIASHLNISRKAVERSIYSANKRLRARGASQ